MQNVRALWPKLRPQLIDSQSPYCPACVASFTVLDALGADRENESVVEKPRKKTGPKPGSVRFRGRVA